MPLHSEQGNQFSSYLTLICLQSTSSTFCYKRLRWSYMHNITLIMPPNRKEQFLRTRMLMLFGLTSYFASKILYDTEYITLIVVGIKPRFTTNHKPRVQQDSSLGESSYSRSQWLKIHPKDTHVESVSTSCLVFKKLCSRLPDEALVLQRRGSNMDKNSGDST